MPLRPRNLHRSRRSGPLRSWTAWIYFPLALLLCVLGVCLWKSGRWLVSDDAVDKVAWAAVLAGESRDCERTEAAIKLYLDGKVDTIVISSERILKNRYASQFLVNDYVREGVPRGKVFEFHHDAYSTMEEARLLIRQFRLQNLDTVLIITSNFHSARARRTFRKLSQGFPHILVHPANYHAYEPASWWSSRESTEIWFLEWMKTIYNRWELLSAPAETGKAEYQNLIPDIWGPGLIEASKPAEPQDSLPPADTARDTMSSTTPPRGDALEDSARDTATAAPTADSAALAAADTARPAEPVADTAKAAPKPKEPAKPKPAKAAAKDTAKKPDKKTDKGKKKGG